jgi:tripartite-type tricarboxylate transporter receptor subunit TctC
MPNPRSLIPGLITVAFAGSASFADISEGCRAMLAGERLTLAVPNNAGGGYDTYARALAPAVEKYGQLSVRVTNMPGGGGRVARGFVMNSDAQTLNVLIENTADMVAAPMGNVGRDALADKDFIIEGLHIVGILHSEPSAWFGRAGLDLFDPNNGKLVSAEGGFDEAVLPVFVAARALGLEIDAITGYDGTSEMVAAVLRQEADVSSASFTTGLRRAQDEGIDLVLLLSEGPHPDAAEVPYIAGEGSLTWVLTADLPEAEAAYRRMLATAVARLRTAARGIFVSANLANDRRDCIAELMDIAIASPEFAATAAAQDRPVAPMTAAEAEDLVADLIASHAEVLPALEEIVADLKSR